MIDLTPLLQAVIALIASIITLKVIPWIKARTTAQQQVLLRSTTEILVRAAKQLYGSGKGQEKINYVEIELERRGYQVDTAAIEAAVRAMNLESGWIQAQTVKLGQPQEHCQVEIWQCIKALQQTGKHSGALRVTLVPLGAPFFYCSNAEAKQVNAAFPFGNMLSVLYIGMMANYLSL